jgi:hypothetical protein
MYEDAYDLNGSETQQVQEILAEMSLRGGRLTDAAGRPIAYRVLRGRRWLVCDKHLVWRYVPEGSPQVPGTRGGACRRNSAIEMWTGRWRKVLGADGKPTYAKQIVWVPLDDHVNGHPGISKLGWYRSEKGFSHPFDQPDAPTAEQIDELEGRRAEAEQAVYARMMVEGLAAPKSSSGDQAARSGSPAAGEPSAEAGVPRRSRRNAS